MNFGELDFHSWRPETAIQETIDKIMGKIHQDRAGLRRKIELEYSAETLRFVGGFLERLSPRLAQLRVTVAELEGLEKFLQDNQQKLQTELDSPLPPTT